MYGCVIRNMATQSNGQQAYPNGSVDLRDPSDDRVFKVNGQRVKLYVMQQVIKEEILLMAPP